MDDRDSLPASQRQERVQDLRLYKVPTGFRGRSAFVTQLWWLVQATIFACSPQFMYGWRNWLLRCFGCKIGNGTIIRQSVRVTYPWKVTIGERCQIGDNVELYSLGDIILGDDVVISQRSYICTGSHDLYSKRFDLYAETIVIEDEAWICAGVFVYPGVTIARGSVVAAHAAIGKSTEPYLIYGGVPAKVIGDRRVAR